MVLKHSLLTAIFIGSLVAAHASTARRVSSALPLDITRGQKLFVAHCAVCHGIGGTGGRGPSLNQAQLRRAGDDQALFRVIRNGIEETEMPGAWQLTDVEIRDVIGYVRSLGRTEVTKLPGNSARGKSLYEGKGACANCHILNGNGGNLGPDLTSIGAQRSAAYIREALVDPGASVPEDFLVVGVVMRDGRRVRGIRANEDSFTIQLRDSTGVFHSFRKSELTELRKEFNASLMPSLRESLAKNDIDDLVAFLAGLRGQQ
jgi:cytochrome c oxidase cbb3-type subunit III